MPGNSGASEISADSSAAAAVFIEKAAVQVSSLYTATSVTIQLTDFV